MKTSKYKYRFIKIKLNNTANEWIETILPIKICKI